MKKVLLLILIAKIILFQGCGDNPESLKRKLFKAAERGQQENIEAILSEYPQMVNVRDEYGRTLLHSAVSSSSKELVQNLIEKGVDVNAQGSGRWSPIHLASAQGLNDIIEILVSNGADVNLKQGHGQTPLHLAATRCHYPKTVDLLISCGADVNARDDSLDMPLHNAAGSICEDDGPLKVIKLLAENGADINSVNSFGMTPLNAANNRKRCELLKSLGGKLRTSTGEFVGDEIDWERYWEEVEKAKRQTESHPSEPLNEDILNAVIEGDYEKVKSWLSKTPDAIGNSTLLAYAVFSDQKKIVEFLISEGADVNKPQPGLTPLYWAAEEGQYDMAQLLLANDAKVNSKCRMGRTALHRAALKDSPLAFVKLLILNGADVNAKDNFSNTPLHVATFNKVENDQILEVIKLLVAEGADINAVDSYECSPLDYAIARKHRKKYELLKSLGAKPGPRTIARLSNDGIDTADEWNVEWDVDELVDGRVILREKLR